MARKTINPDDVLADLTQRITAAGGKLSFRALSQQLTDAGKESYIPYIRQFTASNQLASAQEFETPESSRATPMISLIAAAPATPAAPVVKSGGSK